MKPKPSYLSSEFASAFCDESVAAAYHTRAPHPDETFDILSSLLSDRTPNFILDLGCGTGDLTIPLARRVDHIDAVDFSEAMLAQASSRPGGDSPIIQWHCSPAEKFESEHTYSLVCAGDSLHWMDWQVLFPRIKRMMSTDGFLAITMRWVEHPCFSKVMKTVVPRYSTNPDLKPFDLFDELSSRGLFVEHGRKKTCPVPFEQELDNYIESLHARNDFSRDRMSPDSVAEFDELVRNIVSNFSSGNTISGEIHATVVWGKPSEDVEIAGD